MVDSAKIARFKRYCLSWEYVLANPRDGHVTTIAGGQPQSEAACLAVAPFGIRIVGLVGIVPIEDRLPTGVLYLDAEPDTMRLAKLGAHQWEAGLIERGDVTPDCGIQ